jgi:Xaa-Pro dipeptidase
LFIPKEDPLETIWSPPPPALEAARSSHSYIDVIEYNSLVHEKLSFLLKSNPDAKIHTLPSGPGTIFPRLHIFFSDNSGTNTSKYLLLALHQARLIKTPYEIELIRKANSISSRAHELIMRLLGKHAREDILGGVDEGKLVMPGDWRIEREAEGEAVFVAACRREG